MLRITPDQMHAAAGYIIRNWGDYGYSVEQIDSPTYRVSLFHVVASDGSRFIVAADRWGNCRTVNSHGYETPERTEALRELVADMHAAAASAA